MKDLLVCIAHHAAPGRREYLRQVLRSFSNEYGDYDVIVDTNAVDLDVTGENITVVSHPSLQHPFFLCWCHRAHMKRLINDYRYFYYTEDDIYLPYENFVNYHDNFRLLWPERVPSFVRIETNAAGEKFIVDVTEKEKVRNLHVAGGKVFRALTQAYHGFWLMPQAELKATMIPNFDRLSDSRETAASYPMWELHKLPVVELDENGQIIEKCFAFHLSNTYVNGDSAWGKIRVEEVFS